MASARNILLRGNERWIGPFRIRNILQHSIDYRFPRPPESRSAYVVTRRPWIHNPNPSSKPLYIGGNTGGSKRFRTRLGDLLADAFGFFGNETGHSSGGQSLHRWCRRNHVNPLNLYVAWVEHSKCHRCLEVRLHGHLKTKLNQMKPPKCEMHRNN